MRTFKQLVDAIRFKRLIGKDPDPPTTLEEGQVRYSRSGDTTGDLSIARYVAGGTYEWKSMTAAAATPTIIVKEGGVTVDANTTTLDFTGSQFDLTSSPAGEANISVADAYVLNTGDTMTGALIMESTLAQQFVAKDAGSTTYFRVDTSNHWFGGGNAADLRMYSDAISTVVAAISGTNGGYYFGLPGTGIVQIRMGSGSPESAVTAPVGSFYLRSDGGSGTTVYVKESGAGNTGWIAIKSTTNATLDDLTDVDVASPGSIAGKGVFWDGASSWTDGFVYTETLGPWYGDDVAGTATTAMKLLYMNTGTAVSQSTNRIRAGRTGYVVGARITSDAARTAGTCTVEVDLSGVSTAFDSGSVVLDGTRTTQDASIVTPSAGVAITSGSDTIGVNLVTSGWTPTTANVQVTLLVMWAPI